MVKYYGPDRKYWEGWYLRAKEVTRTSYEWWQGQAESVVVREEGQDERTGKWTWWFPNGQKQVEGVYSAGLTDLEWAWWHPNGQRWIAGSYVLGKKSGVWKHWASDGRLERTENRPILKRPVDAPPVVNLAGVDGQDDVPAPADKAKPEGRDEVPAPTVKKKDQTESQDVPSPVAPPK